MRKLLFSLLLLTTACSIGDHPQIAIYTINSVTATPSELKCPAKISLQIIEPNVAPGLDSQRIAIMQSQQRINYYSGVKWAAPVSEMLRVVLVDSFEKSGAFASISSDLDTIHSDMTLLTDIRNFEVTTDGKIRVRLVAKLVNTQDRKILASIQVEKILSPDAYKMDSFISSFNTAAAAASSEIVSKSIEALPVCHGANKHK